MMINKVLSGALEVSFISLVGSRTHGEWAGCKL